MLAVLSLNVLVVQGTGLVLVVISSFQPTSALRSVSLQRLPELTRLFVESGTLICRTTTVRDLDCTPAQLLRFSGRFILAFTTHVLHHAGPLLRQVAL